jgi:hypothetical protein
MATIGYGGICYDGCLTGMTSTEKYSLYNRIRLKLGAPIMGVELTDDQIEVCVCESVEYLSDFINQWTLENRMSQMLGLPNDIDFTLKYVSNNFNFERTFATAYSELNEGSQNSIRPLKTGSIPLSAGTQDYYIPEGRDVSTLLWFTPNFINLFGLDPFSQGNIAYTEFGASFAGYSLYSVMPVFDTLLTAQSAQVRNKVRASEYSYRLTGGPNGTKRLTLYPIPTTSNGSAGDVYPQVSGFYTPGTLFYNYYDTIGYGAGNDQMSGNTANPLGLGLTGKTQGNGLVSGPSDAILYNLTYSELNDWAKNWVKKYAQANAKELLGLGIRGKFSGNLPIPGKELTLNSSDLIDKGRADMEFFRTELKERLEKLNYKAIAEMNATIQESVNKTLTFSPLGIYIG